LAAFLLWAYGPVVQVFGDEGMWLLNDPPRQLLKDKYAFDLTDRWLEHARLASVRFNSGGSGSFVAADGLVITNHHVGADCLHKVSTKDKDYYRDGLYARTRADELKCPDLELNVLQSIEDVTDLVNAAVKADMTPAQAFAARRAAMATIEKNSLDKTKLRSDVVTLYQGGLYHLYRYKKYTDVRLVFAPEHAVASFGGDVDNFEFPRFDLDICFFRVYENDEPLHVQHWLTWSEQGPREDDLVFVIGNPGSTNRQDTLARLRHRRDMTLPYVLNRLRSREAMLIQFAARGPEEHKMAMHDLPRVANARKAFMGQYQGLLDPTIIARKAQQERELRSRIAADPKLRETTGNAWQKIADAVKVQATLERDYSLLERADAFDSELFHIARHLVRLAAEKPKPSTERLREYRDSNLESLEFHLFSPAPLHPELEQAKLANSFSFLAENLGGEHFLTIKVLGEQTPAARAAQLIAGTKLVAPSERKRLAEGGMKAIEASTDPLIRLARLIDPDAREVRQRYEDEVEEVERQAYAQIAKARFAIYGHGIAPDATFTLRLAYGKVAGYRAEGENVPFFTTFGGMFERAERQGQREPFELPRRWREGQKRLNLSAPVNFVSTADTIGGNSGSPVLNRAGEFVGINFDRNRFGLVRNFVYTDEQARHIAVHSRGILEALRSLYDAEPLLKELTRH
jgi:hypothetical protein